MIRLAIAALAALLVTAPAFAAEPPAAPVTLKSAKQGDVTFKHETHKAQKCDTCHKGEPGKMTPPLDMKSAHGLCQDCHKKAATAKAPTKCTECHQKKA
jgi:hypothetical protein